MDRNTKATTQYFRSAVAAQANMGIDFKADFFIIVHPDEVIQGRIDAEKCKSIFAETKKKKSNDDLDSGKKDQVHVIICAKTIKILYESSEKIQNEIRELTGIYYIPAILDNRGQLRFDEAEKKLPWFPREYLQPMVEPVLAIGNAGAVDHFLGNHTDQIERIRSWSDYVAFFKKFYEAIAESPFEQNTIRNLEKAELPFELESNMYLFLDQTVHSTAHIMHLYNHLLADHQPKPLFESFLSARAADSSPLVENGLPQMQAHCGQMNGQYPLSPSQREVIHHINLMEHGEILAVNGPPGTGKTTLLQTVVADLFVKRALKKEKAPLIVAA